MTSISIIPSHTCVRGCVAAPQKLDGEWKRGQILLLFSVVPGLCCGACVRLCFGVAVESFS